MPDLTFFLPHWIYWLSLIVIPLLCMIVIRRQKGEVKEGQLSYGIAYMFWFFGGIAGLHRLYLKNKGVLIYLPLLVAVLFTNVQVKEAVNKHSGAMNEKSIAEFKLERAQTKFDLEKQTLEGDSGQNQEALEAARQNLEEAKQAMASAKQNVAAYTALLKKWEWVARILAIIFGVLLLIDAFLLPGLVRKRAAYEAGIQKEEKHYEFPEEEGGEYSPAAQVHRPWLDWIDKLNGYVGEFICYWSIIAVFVYYYEVIARYFFNSPTNWAHEGMFLMFGMQYMLAAGYTLREGGHVHVDIIYNRFSDRMKALVDALTSVFFFIFSIAILWTGWTFFMDSVQIWEVSFTEWAIAYWPVKLAIPLGALLLTLQGFTRLFKDIIFLTESKV